MKIISPPKMSPLWWSNLCSHYIKLSDNFVLCFVLKKNFWNQNYEVRVCKSRNWWRNTAQLNLFCCNTAMWVLMWFKWTGFYQNLVWNAYWTKFDWFSFFHILSDSWLNQTNSRRSWGIEYISFLDALASLEPTQVARSVGR